MRRRSQYRVDPVRDLHSAAIVGRAPVREVVVGGLVFTLVYYFFALPVWGLLGGERDLILLIPLNWSGRKT